MRKRVELRLVEPVSGIVSRGYKYPYHNGFDYAAPRGTQVIASEDGLVVRASFHSPSSPQAKSYGHIVVIDHTPEATENEQHIYTLYAHLYGPNISEGQYIKKGDTVGYVGNTGSVFSTIKPENIRPQEGTKGDGSHLHFEVIDSKTEMPWRTEGPVGFKGHINRKDPRDYLGRIIILEFDQSEEEKSKILEMLEFKPYIDLKSGVWRVDVKVNSKDAGCLKKDELTLKVKIPYGSLYE